MQKPVRYYIVKADDQPVVRTVPVALPDATSDEPSAVQPAVDHGASASDRSTLRAEVARRGVARLMRAAIRRNQRRQ